MHPEYIIIESKTLISDPDCAKMHIVTVKYITKLMLG